MSESNTCPGCGGNLAPGEPPICLCDDTPVHPDAYCTLSNMPCNDLSEALVERDRLRARIAELEAEHPDWMHRIRRERREAVALAVDSINVQLREHGIDMQFDAVAFISK